MASMPLNLVPLVGPFHRRFPRYNAITVREITSACAPELVATTALPPGALAEAAWRDADEPALIEAIHWAVRVGVPVEPVGEPSPDPSAMRDTERYLRESTGAHPALQAIDGAAEPVVQLLRSALDLSRVQTELAPAVAKLHAARIHWFGDGPGTDWLEARARRMAERLRPLAQRRTVVLVPVDQLPALEPHLEGLQGQLPDVPPSDAARRRALLDTALSGDADDTAALLAALRDLGEPEARLAEAEVLLGHGHAAEALEVLAEAARGDFVEPPYLPGWLLARLGQLYDLAGRRDEAKRCYRGVLALSWAPPATREAARDGLERPFTVPAA